MGFNESTVGGPRPLEEQQTSVYCRPGEHLLVPEMNNVSEVFTLGNESSKRLAVLRVEELMRADVGKMPI